MTAFFVLCDRLVYADETNRVMHVIKEKNKEKQKLPGQLFD
jgi:hypothetical protein